MDWGYGRDVKKDVWIGYKEFETLETIKERLPLVWIG